MTSVVERGADIDYIDTSFLGSTRPVQLVNSAEWARREWTTGNWASVRDEWGGGGGFRVEYSLWGRGYSFHYSGGSLDEVFESISQLIEWEQEA